MAQGLKDLLEATRSRIQEIGVADAVTLMEKEPAVLFLDVRESEERAGGRIKGALHIPRGLIEPKAAHDSPAREPRLSDFDQTIIAYCESGVRSAFVADSLQVLGFTNVRSLAGGFGAWKKRGYPIES